MKRLSSISLKIETVQRKKDPFALLIGILTILSFAVAFFIRISETEVFQFSDYSAVYHPIVADLLSGKGLDAFTYLARGSARVPGYPLAIFLSSVFTGDPLEATRLVGALAALTSIVAAWLISYRLSSWRAAAFTAALLSASTFFMQIGLNSLPDLMFTALLLLYTLLLVGSKAYTLRFALAGLVGALAIITKLNGVFIFLLVPLPFFLAPPTAPLRTRSFAIVVHALPLLLAMLFLAFVSRHIDRLGRPIDFSGSGAGLHADIAGPHASARLTQLIADAPLGTAWRIGRRFLYSGPLEIVGLTLCPFAQVLILPALLLFFRRPFFRKIVAFIVLVMFWLPTSLVHAEDRYYAFPAIFGMFVVADFLAKSLREIPVFGSRRMEFMLSCAFATALFFNVHAVTGSHRTLEIATAHTTHFDAVRTAVNAVKHENTDGPRRIAANEFVAQYTPFWSECQRAGLTNVHILYNGMQSWQAGPPFSHAAVYLPVTMRAHDRPVDFDGAACPSEKDFWNPARPPESFEPVYVLDGWFILYRHLPGLEYAEIAEISCTDIKLPRLFDGDILSAENVPVNRAIRIRLGEKRKINRLVLFNAGRGEYRTEPLNFSFSVRADDADTPAVFRPGEFMPKGFTAVMTFDPVTTDELVVRLAARAAQTIDFGEIIVSFYAPAAGAKFRRLSSQQTTLLSLAARREDDQSSVLTDTAFIRKHGRRHVLSDDERSKILDLLEKSRTWPKAAAKPKKDIRTLLIFQDAKKIETVVEIDKSCTTVYIEGETLAPPLQFAELIGKIVLRAR